MPASDAKPRRILALDGGGIRGVFSLMILRRIEELFRAERGQAGLVLRDCFDFFAGTSTGAIIATLLAWGYSVDDILALYREQGGTMFTHSDLLDKATVKYQEGPLAGIFRRVFGEEELGTLRLWDPADPACQKYLLIVLRNASTGSAWPICNNPRALYNDPALADCNLRVPLWQLLRGSTAAPTFFRPQPIRIGDRSDLFVDGGMTPYNNPALIAALMATLPAYRIDWPAGVERLHVVSIGTGIQRTRFTRNRYGWVLKSEYLDAVQFATRALLDAVVIEQDLLCRVLGACVFGERIDSEIGDLHGASLLTPAEKKFRYVRYNRIFTPEEIAGIERRTHQPFQLDNIGLMPELIDLGTAYAVEHVRREHLFPEH